MTGLPDIQPAGRVQAPNVRAAAGVEGRAAAGMFGRIRQAASELRQQLQPMLDERAQREGAEAAGRYFEDREDDRLPDVQRRIVFSRQDVVYNQSLDAGVLARAQIDIETEAARLRTEHQFDPAGYEAATEEYLEGYMSNVSDVSPLVGQEIELTAERLFARDGARIASATRVRQIKEDQDALERRLQQIQAKINTGIAQSPAFTQTDEFVELQSDLENIVGTLVDNPAYGWSAERGAQQLDAIANSGQESVLYGEVDAIFAEQGEIGAVQFIEEQIAQLELTNAERIGLRSRLMQRVNMAQNIQNERLRNRALREREIVARQKSAANSWQAEAIRRRAAGEDLDEAFVREGILHIQTGGASAAQIEAQLNIPDEGEVVTDQSSLALAFDMARRGEERDVVEQATLDLVLQGQITASQRESVLSEFDQYNDDTLKSGMATVRSFFSQSSFVDFNTSLPVLEDEVRRDLLDWFEQNPEATRGQIESQAIKLSIERGRTIPAPGIRGLASPPNHTGTAQEFQQWKDSAEEQVAADQGLSDFDIRRLMDDIDQYEAWWEYQQALLRAAQNNGEQ